MLFLQLFSKYWRCLRYSLGYKIHWCYYPKPFAAEHMQCFGNIHPKPTHCTTVFRDSNYTSKCPQRSIEGKGPSHCCPYSNSWPPVQDNTTGCSASAKHLVHSLNHAKNADRVTSLWRKFTLPAFICHYTLSQDQVTVFDLVKTFRITCRSSTSTSKFTAFTWAE